jgi:prolipoprotein diacylglyceryltransferase
MSNEGFIVFLAILFAAFATWAFKALPHERWQILASVPVLKDAAGRWHGLNFTYYGLLTANALIVSAALLIVLLGSLNVPSSATLTVLVALLAVCLPAAKWVARLVEGKNYTFTVAGAFFVGMFAAPAVLRILNSVLARAQMNEIPLMPALAALATVSAVGEGLGRIACISFGCCYGKPLAHVHPRIRRIFEKWNFVFSGEMKKICYASGMAGTQVVPIQAITSTLYVMVGLVSALLFLRRHFALSFVLAVVTTQGWRCLSEMLRADNRGTRKITAYQIMGVIAIVYSLGLLPALGTYNQIRPDLNAGMDALWRPEVVLFLQALWTVVFIFFGKSMVTGAQISFHLYQDRI